MNVMDTLASVIPDVGDQSPPVAEVDTLGNGLHDLRHLGPDARGHRVIEIQINERVGNVLLGNDQNVVRRSRVDVAECQDTISLGYWLRWDFSSHDPAKDAVGCHSISLMTRRTVARSERTSAARNSMSV